MPKPHAPYPPAFKDEAVRLVLSGDKSIAAIALDLGVSDPTLRSWVRQAEIDAGTRDGLTTSEQIESPNRGVRSASSSRNGTS